MPKSTPEAREAARNTAQQERYLWLAARTNEAMSKILEKLAGMNHDAKMEVMRAVVAYSAVDYARRVQLDAIQPEAPAKVGQ